MSPHAERFHTTFRKAAAYGALACFAAGSEPGLAALTDISNVPLASTVSAQVKPNIMFVLDDSGSMGWEYMPDSVSSDTSRVGFKNYRCNTIYYNPAITYSPPKNPDGTNFADSSFTAAKVNGYSGTSPTNLSTSFMAHDSDTAQQAYYYDYSGSQTLVPHVGTCRDSSSSSYPHTFTATGGGTWTKIRVSSTSGPGGTDERQNFANWYTYYRIRMYMAKAAASRAFVQLTDSYRVGFITINPGSPVSSGNYLAVGDFDSTQKTNWFAKLFSQSASGGTPLREALSRVGRHYAGKQDGINNGMTGDPVQYACQQNFTILTSDGYWNGNSGDKLDGTAVGNEDSDLAVAPRPMWDGTQGSSTISTDQSNEYRYRSSGCSSGKQRIQYRTTTRTTTTFYDSGGTQIGTPTVSTSGPTSWATATWLTAACTSSAPALPNPNPQRPTGDALPQPPSGCAAWPCSSTGAGTGGSTGSLADVAQYYYNTDLRPTGSMAADGTTDVGEDIVPATGQGSEDDKASWQHMTTFTMGLGLSGTLSFKADYKTATTGDFADIRAGTKTWPVPSSDDPTALDDLWHAAVNGRGQFFSAADPDTVIDGLASALAGINARVASAAAAATSNLEPVAGDNFAYTAKYVTTKWTGEVEAHEINLDTGEVDSAVVWSAQTKLDAKTKNACDNRSIYLFRSGATDNLTAFAWDTYACDGSGNPTGSASTGLDASEQGNFGSAKVALLSQYPVMTDGSAGTADQRTAAAGANLVNFLRGQRGKEGFVTNDVNTLYRAREHVLGDIINAQPVYVKGPFAEYTDSGYSSYKSANANRTPMVYAAANDGMLHAFYAGASASDVLGGEEAWAVVPSMVLPNLYKLADDNYANNHTYSVDGTPSVGDMYDTTAGSWKTILVAGLNSGGKGYYALDITNPVAPKGMWEFKWSSTCYDAANSATWGADCHLGYTFGNPVISKLADGTWVVFVTSGYNNVNSPAATGDGLGYLYVLNAATGKIIYKLSTGTGSAATPSGLNHITNWVDDTTVDNTTLRVYGVDLLGNIWRFDVNDTIAPGGREATRLATAKSPDGTGQPITTRPELAEVGTDPFVYVATGRLVGASDLPNVQVQSIYGIKDPLTATAYTDLRTSLKEMTMTVVGSGANATRTIDCNAQCTSTDGWYVDLPDSGERVNVDMRLQLGTLVVASNVPQTTACTIGGYSWLNYLNFATGAAVASSPGLVVSQKLSSSLAVGLNIVRLPSGKTVVISTTSDAKQTTVAVPFDTPAPTGKRVSWREIAQ